MTQPDNPPSSTDFMKFARIVLGGALILEATRLGYILSSAVDFQVVQSHPEIAAFCIYTLILLTCGVMVMQGIALSFWAFLAAFSILAEALMLQVSQTPYVLAWGLAFALFVLASTKDPRAQGRANRL